MYRSLILLCVLIGIFDIYIEGAAPVFSTGLPTSYSIPDSTGTGVSVANVIFTDSDVGDNLTITMVFNEYFQFTDNGDKTGILNTSTSTSVLGASGTSVTLIFIARDTTDLTATASYNITVTNEAPTLNGLPTTTQLSEVNTEETLVYTINCTDPSDTVSASLLSVTPSNSPLQEFFLVQLITSSTDYGVYARAQTNTSQGTFSYSAQRDYIVQIACTDQKSTVSGNLTVNLQQNQSPVITTPSGTASQNVVSSTVSGTVVYTLTATDADNDTITFNYTSVPANAPVRILSSGAVQATSDFSSIAPSTSYVLTITPTDGRNTGSSVTLTLVITGSNNAPTFTNLNSTITVNENTATSTSLFQVSTSDADGDTLTLYMTSNPVFGTLLFDLDASNNITTISALNYEAITDKVYELIITTSDGTASVTATLTVSLVNVNENLAWTASTYRVDIAEGSAVGTTLSNIGLNTTDPDTGDTLTCYMSCYLPGYFSISTSCVITVSSVYSFDAGQTITNVTCSVNGTDSGGSVATTTLIIDIVDTNNYTPTFAVPRHTFIISGYEAINTTLGTVSATDSDVGTFGEFSYSLDQSALSTTAFNINATSGVITTAISIENCLCTGTTWSIPILATDLGGLVGTATASIIIGATTTVTTTTTTNSAKLFMEIPSNSAWFTVFLVALVIAGVITGFVLITHVFNSTRFICRTRHRPRNRLFHGDGSGDYPMYEADIPARNYPPPNHYQPWRNQPSFY